MRRQLHAHASRLRIARLGLHQRSLKQIVSRFSSGFDSAANNGSLKGVGDAMDLVGIEAETWSIQPRVREKECKRSAIVTGRLSVPGDVATQFVTSEGNLDDIIGITSKQVFP